MEDLFEYTKITLNDWKNHRGWAPNSVSELLDKAMFDCTIELTDALHIWLKKGNNISSGELILAYANLGSLVENWLKFFYCIYFIDYQKNPVRIRNKIIKKPTDLKFIDLENFSTGILWKNNDFWNCWVTKIRQRRNTIHSFNYKYIGNPEEFLKDVELFFDFIKKVSDQFPDSPREARSMYF